MTGQNYFVLYSPLIYIIILVTNKGFIKKQLLLKFINEDLGCNLNSEMDQRNFNILSNYVQGLKIVYMIPNQPNSKRTFKAVGLLESATKF